MTAADSGLFSTLNTPTARLMRVVEPPEVTDLDPGDMVICADEWGVEDFAAEAAEKGVHVRVGRYRQEVESVLSVGRRRGLRTEYTPSARAHQSPPGDLFDPNAVQVSTDAFAKTWDALSAPLDSSPCYEDAHQHLPADWVRFLPFPTLNPAQVQALPAIMSGRQVVIVAPTGAGKTAVGMIAALREIKADRPRKVAWLVPQRSLTAELDRELDVWRRQGLKVVALSGETATDTRLAQQADLWVATTEKFEALCRSTSMRQAIAQIGTLVVDEVHLLGEPSRGPMLETLLARIRGADSPVRLVGLSATAANADQVAEWLGADLVQIAWRATRQTTQVLTIPSGDRQSEGRSRNQVCAEIAREVTADGGSVLVFCGTKANVRSAALAVASSRGASVTGVDPDDVDGVHEVCADAGVVLHYSDWPHKRDSERLFRQRSVDVLVATSTLAAGVNTPARAVIVRDTTIGPMPMEVSMVQQMFGRAGRAGQEAEGWSYLVTTADETARWRQRLGDGYTIRSGILNGIADHLLAEIVQGHVRTLREAERWWVSTLAYHQGSHSTAPLHAARTFLDTWHFIDAKESQAGDQDLTVTPLGSMTSKMMVGVSDAANLVARLTRTATPRHHQVAEETLVDILVSEVAALSSGADAPADQAPAVARLLAARGDVTLLGQTAPARSQGLSRERVDGGQVCRAGLLLVLRSPRALASRSRQVVGINRSLLGTALYDSPRYLAWLARLGPLNVVPAWACVAAADMAQRVTWHKTGAPLGAGRVLALCERLAGPTQAQRLVPDLYREAVQAGATRPEDWPLTSPTAGSGIDPSHWSAALGAHLTLRVDQQGGIVASPSATVLAEAPGASGPFTWQRVSLSHGKGSARGLVAAFGGGDSLGSGWLDKFSRMRL